MKIRKYIKSDCPEIINLFYETVHTINIKDYSQEQVDVWAPKNVDVEKWNTSFLKNHTFVVLNNQNKIIGFGDIEDSGYLDRLYVHKDYQKMGVATLLCNTLENSISTDIKEITTHASITAKPFFEKRGYKVIKEQQVIRNGISLTNFIMKKFI